MHASLSRSWGLVLLRGILAVLFGIAAFLLPGTTALALVTLFGAFALVDGIFALVAAFRLGSEDGHWWPLILEGITGILFGIVAFAMPAAIAAALVYIVAAWAVITGIMEIAAALRLRRVINNEVWLALSGLFSLFLGIILFVEPGAGIIAWAWMIGCYALVYGVALISLAFRLRGHTSNMTHRTV